MELKCAGIEEIADMGEGSRVEIDFIDALADDEGVLVGDTANGFLLVLAETRETETYPPRPFRVNAGAIHQYVYLGNDKTKYLSELKAGDQLLVTNGIDERFVAIGRVKIERREFLRFCLETGISATLQKADSLFVAGEKGAFHCIDAAVNDRIHYVEMKSAARHKGLPIKESITEK